MVFVVLADILHCDLTLAVMIVIVYFAELLITVYVFKDIFVMVLAEFIASAYLIIETKNADALLFCICPFLFLYVRVEFLFHIVYLAYGLLPVGYRRGDRGDHSS